MLKTPLMSLVFDFSESTRAKANGKTPFNKEIRVEKDVVYKSVDGVDLHMDIYYPSAPIGGKAPLVIEIPGGGWMIHNRRRRDGYARLFAVMGAVVAVIDHRLCPAVFFPQNLIDCIDVLNFFYDNQEKYNIDINNVTVSGDSSGGHLAACIGCAATDEDYCKKLEICAPKIKPAAFIMISGAFSFEVMYRIPFTHLLIVRYICGCKSRKAYRQWKYYKECNPYNYINKDFPPTYNNGGNIDFLCFGEAKRMSEYLDEAGVANAYNVGRRVFSNFHCDILRLPYKNARADMLKLCRWYSELERSLGVDISNGYKRVETFLLNYRDAIKGRIEC